MNELTVKNIRARLKDWKNLDVSPRDAQYVPILESQREKMIVSIDYLLSHFDPTEETEKNNFDVNEIGC